MVLIAFSHNILKPFNIEGDILLLYTTHPSVSSLPLKTLNGHGFSMPKMTSTSPPRFATKFKGFTLTVTKIR